ncbi:homoserine kinase [Alkalihalobacillus sp. AL-G]|uniref:homoserine kinase n=1 Tax=Alkalihalobacillus sp. AL-G TaxID=2926399 RepID=UPI00272BE21F|nr:homoserine kinase [Alkalihalobacillus sp. AL-G]WLD93128.1 homoserine kinase [Alkalihalobacillus sp. AL-G]
MNNMGWKITVPASTANLGPGFDSIGLALNRYLTLYVSHHHLWEVAALSPSLEDFPKDERNFIVRIAIETCTAFGVDLAPCSIQVKSDIPLARGLGSSAAAIVAGIELADVVGNLGLSQKSKLELATHYEGHSDNVGASLYGGLVVSCETDEGIELLPIDELPICVVTVSPEEELKTEKAREVLPERLSFSEAVKAGGVSNVLIAALLKQDWQLAGKMMKGDRYHQPYRKPLLPHYELVERIAERNGAFGVALSGAGSTIACFAEETKAEWLYRQMYQSFPDMSVQIISIDNKGMTTETMYFQGELS